MCRVEERVYISGDGHRSRFEDTFPCDKSRKGRLCADVKKRTTEYFPKKGSIARSDTPSPVNPPTPTGTGAYIVQRRPSSSGGRSSTRDGGKPLIIEFGSNKPKAKKYPPVSVSTKAYKRSSLGASSNDDIAVDSPGSDASHTLHTGFIDAPLAPYGHSDGYSTTPTLPHGYHHHRHTSSTSSYNSSSRTPSLLITSDPELDPPTNTRTRLPPAIHNPTNTYAPSSPSKSRVNAGASVGGYNITLITPQSASVDSRPTDGFLTHDYPDPADRSTSSRASSGASGKSRRGKEPERSKRRKDEEHSRQEDLAREVAEALSKEENKKQVRFEVSRAEARANERAENLIAQKEKDRAAAREEARREQKERDEEAARERRREKERQKPLIISNPSSKRPSGSRRGSVTMTRAEQVEQQRLLAADLERMQNESRVAEAREREERAATLREQQQDTAYYNPRTGGMPTAGSSTNTSALSRHDPQSRRGSFSSEVRPQLGRSGSNRRASIIQPDPPRTITQVAPSTGYTRAGPPSARQRQPPPLSFHNNNRAGPPSARRPSFSSQEPPTFAQPARGSGSSMDNPFAAPLSPTAVIHQDPWDARSMTNALPAPTQKSDGRYTIERRGQDVITSAAQRATRAMNRSAFETDSDEDDEVMHGHSRRRR